MKLTSLRSTTSSCARVSASSSRRVSPATLEKVTSPLTATISATLHLQPDPVALAALAAPARRALVDEGQAPPARALGGGQRALGELEAGAVVADAEVDGRPGDPQLDLDRRGVRVLDRVGDQLGREQPHVHGGLLSERGGVRGERV